MKTWIQSILLLGNNKQKVVTDGYPYLCEECIHSRSIEGFDVQVLLDPFEKYLNLPSFAIEFSDGYRLQSVVVGQEPIDCTVPKVFIDNELGIVGLLPGGIIANKLDCLVGDKSGLRINLSALQNFILHVVLGPSNEPRMRLMEMGVERIKLDIALIHEIISVRLHRDLLNYLRIVNRGLCKADECRNGTVQVNQRMHPEPILAMMKSCPRTERKAQLNGAAIVGANHLVKVYSQLLASIKVLGFLYQNIAKVLIYTPFSLLVRFCKGGFRHHLQPGPVQILRSKAKSCLNISQAVSVSELSEAHHKELVPAIELDCMPVTFVAIDTLAEFIFGEERHKLCEDCFTLVHGL